LDAIPRVGDLSRRDRAEVLAEERVPHLRIHLDLEALVRRGEPVADRGDLAGPDLLVVAAEDEQQRRADVRDLVQRGLAIGAGDRPRDALSVERDRGFETGQRRREERGGAAVAEAPRRAC
jgi:hypothetical protein